MKKQVKILSFYEYIKKNPLNFREKEISYNGENYLIKPLGLDDFSYIRQMSLGENGELEPILFCENLILYAVIQPDFNLIETLEKEKCLNGQSLIRKHFTTEEIVDLAYEILIAFGLNKALEEESLEESLGDNNEG